MRAQKILFRFATLLMLFFFVSVHAGIGKNLRQAADAGDFETVKRLLEKGVDANSAGGRGGTPMIKATKGGHINIVQLLLFHGGDPNKANKKGRTALEVAKRKEHLEIAAVMTKGIDEQSIPVTAQAMGSDDFTALMRTVFQGRHYRVEKIEPYMITAVYGTSGRVYKVRASMQDNRIMLQFLKGYGAGKINYLKNLKTDLMKKL